MSWIPLKGIFSTLPEFRDGRLGTIQSRFRFVRRGLTSTAYTDAHPKYRDSPADGALTEAELRRVAEEELDGIRGSLNILIGTERRLQREVDRLTELSLQLNRGQLNFERLQRDRQNAEQMYSLVPAANAKEAELERKPSISTTTIVRRRAFQAARSHRSGGTNSSLR